MIPLCCVWPAHTHSFTFCHSYTNHSSYSHPGCQDSSYFQQRQLKEHKHLQTRSLCTWMSSTMKKKSLLWALPAFTNDPLIICSWLCSGAYHHRVFILLFINHRPGQSKAPLKSTGVCFCCRFGNAKLRLNSMIAMFYVVDVPALLYCNIGLPVSY